MSRAGRGQPISTQMTPSTLGDVEDRFGSGVVDMGMFMSYSSTPGRSGSGTVSMGLALVIGSGQVGDFVGEAGATVGAIGGGARDRHSTGGGSGAGVSEG